MYNNVFIVVRKSLLGLFTLVDKKASQQSQYSTKGNYEKPITHIHNRNGRPVSKGNHFLSEKIFEKKYGEVCIF